MKQKDLMLIIVMVFIGAIVAIVVSRFIFSSPKNRQQSAEVVDVITAEFPEPSKKYLNKESVNTAEHPKASAEQTEETTQP